METPAKPTDEFERLAALKALEVLDTAPEERFDRFTRLARRLFNTSIALVSLVDSERQWFKSRQGLDATETPRDISFCGHAILSDEVFVVTNAAEDPRFHDNPLVSGAPHIRFYAGAPLHAPCGRRIGTLCIIDPRPREFDEDDASLLRDVADMVELDLATKALASTDELTGISNRRGLQDIARHALARGQRERKQMALTYFDLDHFKPINDRFGHAAGDAALREFANAMVEVFRQCDVVARIGGDEFCVLMSDVDEAGAAQALARLEDAVSTRNGVSDLPVPIEFSAGTAFADSAEGYALDDLLERADAAMYAVKKEHARSAA